MDASCTLASMQANSNSSRNPEQPHADETYPQQKPGLDYSTQEDTLLDQENVGLE